MMLAPSSRSDVHLAEIDRLISISRPPRMRGLLQFAIDEVVHPAGPYKGSRFRPERQPLIPLIWGMFENPWYRRLIITGPAQASKTFAAVGVPLMHRIAEMQADVGLLCPSMSIAADKWLIDLQPLFLQSRYRELLPTRGPGSRSAFAEMISFTNGSKLHFFSAGGSDSSRAAVSCSALFITEVDDVFRCHRETSQESDPLSQAAGRLLAHGERGLMVMEGTCTTPTGKIWTAWEGGTAGQIVTPCPHCGEFHSPEKNDFVGVDDAKDEISAEETGRFSCPLCGGFISEQQRRHANKTPKLLFRGQTINSDGVISGDAPRTRSGSARWTAYQNQLISTRQLAGEMFRAKMDLDSENAWKRVDQQFFNIPWRAETGGIEISPELVASRLTGLDRGIVPEDAEGLVVAADVHLRNVYWLCLSLSPQAVFSIIDLGISINPDPKANGPNGAISLGLRQLADSLSDKQFKTPSGRAVPIDFALVDGGYEEQLVLQFALETSKPRWRVSKGMGSEYRRPNPDPEVVIGDRWFDAKQPGIEESRGRPWWLIVMETDAWLRIVHNGFTATPFLEDGVTRRPGSIALFGKDDSIHLEPVDKTIGRSAYADQLCAWKWERTVSKKRGEQMAWVYQHSYDHFLDVTYMAACAATGPLRKYHPRFRPKPAPEHPKQEPVRLPGNRPWVTPRE